jgi:hypothetical protein
LRNLIAISVFFLGSTCIFGQVPLADAIDRAVLVQSVIIGVPQAGAPNYIPIEVRLLNISPKPIYAYRIKLVAVWADGSSTSSDPTEDLLALYSNVSRGLQPEPPPPIFRNGETRVMNAGTSARNGVGPVKATATVSLLAFGDRTAIGSDSDINFLTGVRSGMARDYVGICADLKAAIQTPDPTRAAEARSKELLAAQPGNPAVTDSGQVSASPNSFRASALTALVNLSLGDVARMKRSLAHCQDYLEALNLHTDLKVVSQ